MEFLFLHNIMLYNIELVGWVIVLEDDDVGEGEGEERRNTKCIRTLQRVSCLGSWWFGASTVSPRIT